MESSPRHTTTDYHVESFLASSLESAPVELCTVLVIDKSHIEIITPEGLGLFEKIYLAIENSSILFTTEGLAEIIVFRVFRPGLIVESFH